MSSYILLLCEFQWFCMVLHYFYITIVNKKDVFISACASPCARTLLARGLLARRLLARGACARCLRTVFVRVCLRESRLLEIFLSESRLRESLKASLSLLGTMCLRESCVLLARATKVVGAMGSLVARGASFAPGASYDLVLI